MNQPKQKALFLADSSVVADEKQPKTTLSPAELYKWVTDRAPSLLVMDVREAAEFDESHLDVPKIINVPGSGIAPGCVSTLMSIELTEVCR